MVRTPSCDKNGLRKGTWTTEEDKKLIAYITRYGHWNWRLLPKFAGLARCGKSCRLRWLNYLKPNIKRGDFSHDEDDTIIRLHGKLGNRWSAIAANLPGRTDNEIKNHWHTTLKKRLQHKSGTAKSKISNKSKNIRSTDHADNQQNTVAENSTYTGPLLSPQPSSSSGFSCIPTDTTNRESWVLEDDDLSFLDAYAERVSTNFWTEPYLTDTCYVPPGAEARLPVYELEYFSPVGDVELWSHNYSYPHECEGLFYSEIGDLTSS